MGDSVGDFDTDYFEVCSTNNHCFSKRHDICDGLMDCLKGDDESSDTFHCEVRKTLIKGKKDINSLCKIVFLLKQIFFLAYANY